MLKLPDRFEAGIDLPPFFHQVYFWQAVPATDLGRDGHPRVGGLVPDMGLPRRMWAGGRLAFHHPLKTGQVAEKRTTCENAERKSGRSGPLGLVTLRHEYHQAGTHCLTEWQDLVYREDYAPGRPAPQAPPAPASAQMPEQLAFDTTILFRYSALTLNGHRIHYDQPYARAVEGYDGLVVHGPLLAQLLMLKAVRELGPLSGFSFRATSALIHSETAALFRDGTKMWVAGPDGRQCMTAEVTPRSQ